MAKKTKEQIISKIVKDLPARDMRGKMTDAEWHGWFLECWDEAINYSRCSLEFKTVEVDKDLVKIMDSLMRSDEFKEPKKKRF